LNYISFSWSAAIQLPLLELCKATGELQLDQMSDLYCQELKMAHLAAIGKLDTITGGDHNGKPKMIEEETPSAN
jgi:fructose-bisphosphate aldolase class I